MLASCPLQEYHMTAIPCALELSSGRAWIVRSQVSGVLSVCLELKFCEAAQPEVFR